MFFKKQRIPPPTSDFYFNDDNEEEETFGAFYFPYNSSSQPEHRVEEEPFGVEVDSDNDDAFDEFSLLPVTHPSSH